MKLRQIKFNNYYPVEEKKTQIYLHHTAGGPSAENVFMDWQRTPVHVATCIVIGRDGTMVQGFNSKHWAYHLGLAPKNFSPLPYKNLDKLSIGVEICNWGYLTEKDGKYYNYVNKEVTDVCILDKPFKGHIAYENYTDGQIDNLRELLLLWEDKYKIDISYKEDIWDITERALKGENGLYTHNSVRKDKSDVYPHPKLIKMLKTL
jgi:N-acetyl-anhydromuramyl-L-alanine amidase AmpD